MGDRVVRGLIQIQPRHLNMPNRPNLTGVHGTTATRIRRHRGLRTQRITGEILYLRDRGRAVGLREEPRNGCAAIGHTLTDDEDLGT